MGTAGHNLHVDRHSGTITIGNTKAFEQAADCTAVRNRALFAVNVDVDHKPDSCNKKSRYAWRAATWLPARVSSPCGASILAMQCEWRFPTLVLPRSGSEGCRHLGIIVWQLSASHTPSVWLNIADPQGVCKPSSQDPVGLLQDPVTRAVPIWPRPVRVLASLLATGLFITSLTARTSVAYASGPGRGDSLHRPALPSMMYDISYPLT